MTDEIRYSWNDRARKTQSAAAPVAILPTTHTNGGSYADAALNGEIQTLLDTAQGGRNHQLNTSAFNLGQLVASGHLNEHQVRDTLTRAALQIGLTKAETEATINSGLRTGMKLRREVKPLQLATTEHIDPATLIAAHATQEPPTDDDETRRVRTSWWPEPIAQRATQAAEEPAPTHLIRDDNQALFYSSKVNGLIGESESGKSWIALLAIIQAITIGQHVLILDFEDSPASVHRRLQALGCQPHQLALVDYANPDEALGALQSEDLTEAIAAHYQVILADGINAAMTLLGYDLNSNTDATLFSTKLLRPLTRTGACVITVDHVPKNPEARGKGGIGAQAKRAMLDGCALLVEVMEPFGKGQSGTLRLTVDKDRNGAVRGISSGGRYAGKAHLDSIHDQVRITITAPDTRAPEERGSWRPTGVMEKVSRLLEKLDGDPSYRAIEGALGGRKDVIKKAVDALVEDGFIKLSSGPNRSIQHHLERPFRDSDTPTSPVSPGVPQVSPGDTSAGVPQPPPPYGEGDTQRAHPATPVSPTEPGDTHQPELMPADHSSCNHCGKTTPDREIDDNAGYCHECAHLWGGNR